MSSEHGRAETATCVHLINRKPSLKEPPPVTTPKRPKPKPERPALASTYRPPNPVRLEYGDRVHHPAYGLGDVVATEPDRGRATIYFEADHSTRTFVVVRSPLKLVSRQDHRTR